MAKTPTTPQKNTTQDTTKEESSLITANTKISITLPWQDIQPEYQRQISRFSKQLKHDGFRKGKVPAAIAEQMINTDRLVEEVTYNIITPFYAAALDKQHLVSLTPPDIKITKADKNSDWEVTVEIAERPKNISITDYKTITTQALQEAQSQINDLEKAEKDAAKTTNESSSTDPKNNSAPSAQMSEARRNEIKLHHIFRAFIKQLKPNVPELAVRYLAQQELRKLLQTLKQLNIDFQDYLQHRQTTQDQLMQEFAAQAMGQWQLEFILDAIVDDMKISLTDTEVIEAYNQHLDSHHHDHAETSEHDHHLHSQDKVTNISDIPETERQQTEFSLRREKVLQTLKQL